LKSAEESMNILAAYDLTGSYRAAAKLAGCSHHTVARVVAERDAGGPCPRERRPQVIDEFLPKIEEWVYGTEGAIRADKAHEKLVAMGFTGSPRSSRRAVARIKERYRLGQARVHRPWVTEPGLWLQYDFGDGPVIDGRPTVLYCAWLAWSRYRIVIPLRDRTIPSVFAALDNSFRLLGGAPTYVLTDNEKSVTVDHVAGLPVRNQQAVAFGRHYGVTIHTCVPYDPASKGGAENTVKIAKADLVPKDTNLLPQYASFAELEAACRMFMAQVNGRVHRVTRRVPAEMLEAERARLHPVPEQPHTVAFGVTRQVAVNTPMVSYEYGSYSVPHQLRGQTVWVRVHGAGRDERVIIVHVGEQGPVEVARHLRAEPGSPRIDDEHFPPAPPGPLHREPRAKGKADAEFLALGEGAVMWLKEATAQGTSRIRVKMAHAVSMAKLTNPTRVDWALGHAAVHQRFGEHDLASILTNNPDGGTTAEAPRRADETRSLAQGTGGWAALGVPSRN
jgi:transposase